MSNQNEAGYKNNNDSDISNMILLVAGAFCLYVLFLLMVKYLALISTYLFYPFAMPVFTFADSKYDAFLIVFLYALIAFSVGFYQKISFKDRKFKYDKNKGRILWLGIAYGIFWFLVAITEFLFFRKNGIGQVATPLTAHINSFCNPGDSSILYIFNCRKTIDDIGGYSVLMIVFVSLVPNVVYGLPAIVNTIQNFTTLGKHPKKLGVQRIGDVDALINTLARIRPHLLIYTHIDPNTIDYNSGQLRLMDTPRRFCFENDIVDGFIKRPSKYVVDSYKTYIDPDDKASPKFEITPDNNFVPRLNVHKFEEVMMESLGEVFTSIEDLSPTQTIVLALTLPLTCRGDLNMSEEDAKFILEDIRKRCDDIFMWTNNHIKGIKRIKSSKKAYKMPKYSFASYPHLEEYRQILRKWIPSDIAQNILRNHAYINTIILRSLTDAKKLGVFQPSTLRWLMFYDRPLYAVVQNESRPSVFAENAATSSHYYAELKEGKRLYAPKFQTAYDGFMDNLNRYEYSKLRVAAWYFYKNTGDAKLMIKERMVSEDFKNGAN